MRLALFLPFEVSTACVDSIADNTARMLWLAMLTWQPLYCQVLTKTEEKHDALLKS